MLLLVLLLYLRVCFDSLCITCSQARRSRTHLFEMRGALVKTYDCLGLMSNGYLARALACLVVLVVRATPAIVCKNTWD